MKPTMRKPALILAVTGGLLATVAHAEDKVSFHATQYTENQQRINVVMGEVSIDKDFGTDYTARLDLGHDAISGATPMWEPKPGFANEFVEGQQNVANEKRNSVAGTLIARDAARNEYTVGASWSSEPDFLSTGVSAQAQLWHDDSHNRSYIFGAGMLFNTAIATPYTNNREDRSSTVLNVQAGVNQVLDPTSHVEGSVYVGQDLGYLSNHYLKIVRTDAFGAHYLADEVRPEQRNSGGLAARWIKSWKPGVVSNLWYRYYTDDWGIVGHTVEVKAHWDVAPRWRLSPVLRLHHQSAASFYRGYGDAVNTFSATGLGVNDARLGEFTAKTTALNVEYQSSSEWTFNTNLSDYRQDNGFSARWLVAGFTYKY